MVRISPKFANGLWNILEHGLNRVMDAATSVILVWILNPEVFSKIAIAQALVAPVTLFLVNPETVLYRDYARWKTEGPSSIAARLHAFRLFAWGKVQFAFVASLIVSVLFPGTSPWLTRFGALVWAFSLVLTSQVAGPDREFLRIDLRLKELNAISVLQKAFILVGTVVVSLSYPGRIEILAIVPVCALLGNAWIAKRVAKRVLLQEGATIASIRGREGPSVFKTLNEAFRDFSIWNHLNGVILGWVQTMDLLFLGVFRFPAYQVGLYATSLKLANFSTALPSAVGSTFSVWIGRRVAGQAHAEEWRDLFKYSAALVAVVAAQFVFLIFVAPFIFKFLSHGRWSSQDQLMLNHWFRWILAGSSLFASTALLQSWLTFRTPVIKTFRSIVLPWGILSILVYVLMIRSGGFNGAAKGNVVVSLVFILLVGAYRVRQRLLLRR